MTNFKPIEQESVTGVVQQALKNIDILDTYIQSVIVAYHNNYFKDGKVDGDEDLGR